MENKPRISIVAIVAGAVTDLVTSLAGGCAIGGILGVGMAASGMSVEEIQSATKQPTFLTAGLINGFDFTVLGGFVAGFIAKRSETLHGGIVGAIGLVFCALLLTLSSGPIWYTVLSILGVVPAGMAGGFLAGQVNIGREKSRAAGEV